MNEKSKLEIILDWLDDKTQLFIVFGLVCLGLIATDSVPPETKMESIKLIISGLLGAAIGKTAGK